MASSRPNHHPSTPPPTTTTTISFRSSPTTAVLRSAAPSSPATPPTYPRLRRETRSVTSSSIRTASQLDPVQEGVEVGTPTGVATSGSPPSRLLGEGNGEGEEIGSAGVRTAGQTPSPPPYPQVEAESLVVAVAAADMEREEEEENNDEPPEDLLVEPDAETLFHQGMRSLQLAHDNLNLNQLERRAGVLPVAAVNAHRNIAAAERQIHQAFASTHRDFDRHTEQLRREIQRQQDRAAAAHQLRNNLDLLLHQAQLQIQHQRHQIQVLEAAPGIRLLFDEREMAVLHAGRWDGERAVGDPVQLPEGSIEDEDAGEVDSEAETVFGEESEGEVEE